MPKTQTNELPVRVSPLLPIDADAIDFEEQGEQDEWMYNYLQFRTGLSPDWEP